jgi:hypothetical protein
MLISNGMQTAKSTSSREKRLSFSEAGVITGALFGTKKFLGGASKHQTALFSEFALAISTARDITALCPMCTPSKQPSATTVAEGIEKSFFV